MRLDGRREHTLAKLLLTVEWLDMIRKLTKSTEDDKRESVANDPLSNGSKDHEHAAEEEVCSWKGDEVRLGLELNVGWENETYHYQQLHSRQHLSSP